MRENLYTVDIRRIYLWGFMGSGKSTLGRQLANRLGFQFLDLDEVIEDKEEMKIAEIFMERGEEYFRRVEHSILQQIAVINESLVISTGGGTPCYFNNAEIMNASGFSIYLKVSDKALKKRLKAKDLMSRPLVRNLEWAAIMELYKKRQSFYENAHLIIANEHDVEETIIVILEKIGKI